PQLEGVHVQLVGQLVERRLEGEVCLRRARRSVCVGGGFVGRNLEPANVEAREAVGPAQKAGGESGVPAGTGAVVVVVARTKCEQGAVGARAELDVELRRRSRMA